MSGAASGRGGGAAALVVHQGDSRHRTFQAVGWGIFALFCLAVPYLLPGFRVGQFAQVIGWSVVILGMNMVIGYSGLISLGHIAFAGLGAYAATVLINENGWDFWMTLPIVVVVCFLFGVLIGLPALKIKGLYLALVTLALSYTFPILVKIEQGGIARRTGGDNGRTWDEKILPTGATKWLALGREGADVQEKIVKYWMMFALAAVCFLLVRNIIKSRPGRAMIAIRDNQIGAAVSGVNLNQHKVVTFGISAAVTGVGGAMVAAVLDSVGPTQYDANYAILTLMGLVLGGVATLHGCWIGGVLLVFIQDFAPRILERLPGDIPPAYARAVFGVILVLVAFFAPGGLMSLAKIIKARIIQVIPKPPALLDRIVLTEGSPVGEGSLTGAVR
jgi:branched-chain amino acid transport system permease protein